MKRASPRMNIVGKRTRNLASIFVTFPSSLSVNFVPKFAVSFSRTTTSLVLSTKIPAKTPRHLLVGADKTRDLPLSVALGIDAQLQYADPPRFASCCDGRRIS